MKYKFYVCDVFADQQFGGNQLAVIPNATGLTDEQMFKIACEFNYAEVTFVFPPSSDSYTKNVRIFTSQGELPFAGHPNIGTAFVLAEMGEFGEIEDSVSVIFEEIAGPVPIEIIRIDGSIISKLKAPESLTLGSEFDVEMVANLFSIEVDDLEISTHHPQIASVGLPFLFIEVKNRQILEKLHIDFQMFKDKVSSEVKMIHVYTQADDGFDIRARMFNPLDAVPEDPATGSANVALAGLLAHYDQNDTGEFEWSVAQGVEMGRPSRLNISAKKTDGVVKAAWVAGSAVMFSEGEFELI